MLRCLVWFVFNNMFSLFVGIVGSGSWRVVMKVDGPIGFTSLSSAHVKKMRSYIGYCGISDLVLFGVWF